jgi:hypothetical protein
MDRVRSRVSWNISSALLVALLAAASICNLAAAQEAKPASNGNSANVEARVEELLKKMTLEERSAS